MHLGGTGAEKQVPCSQREFSHTMGKFQNPILGAQSWPEGDKESTYLGPGAGGGGGWGRKEKRREGEGSEEEGRAGEGKGRRGGEKRARQISDEDGRAGRAGKGNRRQEDLETHGMDVVFKGTGDCRGGFCARGRVTWESSSPPCDGVLIPGRRISRSVPLRGGQTAESRGARHTVCRVQAAGTGRRRNVSHVQPLEAAHEGGKPPSYEHSSRNALVSDILTTYASVRVRLVVPLLVLLSVLTAAWTPLSLQSTHLHVQRRAAR